jgi:putative addiction module antidote
MIYKTKVQKIGNELGIVLPAEVLDTIGVKAGDPLYITQASGNALRLTSDRLDFAAKMQIAEECMKRYPNALRELAQ